MSRLRVPMLLAVIAIASAAFPAVQSLPEAHALSATFTVTKVADTEDGFCDADCSLREAVTAANANANAADLDLIEFAIPGAGPHVIAISSALTITQAVHINGETQSGASCASPGRTLKIEVRATTTGFNGFVALHTGSPGTTISGVAITGFGFSGANLAGGAAHTVRCSNIGVQADGATALGNSDGVTISTSPSTVIGGDQVSDRNVISGNTNNGVVVIASNGSTIENNYIGVNQGGTAAIVNSSNGIFFGNSTNVEIRSNVVATAAGGRNISVTGNSSDSFIQGNLLGYLADGTTPAASSVSIQIFANTGQVSSGHTIGGLAPGEANRIYTFAWAIEVVVLGTGQSNNNAIRGNSIRGNVLGIALTPVGETTGQITANDPQDGDEGPNHLQNYPVLAAVDTAGTVTGDLNSTPLSTFFVDFYSAGANCAGRDGERYLGSKTVVTDVNGDVSFVATGLDSFTSTEGITATATDADGNTSEFSACVLSPARNVTGVTPAEAVAGTADGLVTVNGVSFINGDVVTINGNPVATTFLSSSALQFTLTEEDKAIMGSLTIGVDGIISEAVFTVTRPSSDVNCTGFTTSDDAVYLLRVLAGLQQDHPNCPGDADKSGGAANIADVLHIRMVVAGLILPLKSLFQ